MSSSISNVEIEKIIEKAEMILNRITLVFLLQTILITLCVFTI